MTLEELLYIMGGAAGVTGLAGALAVFSIWLLKQSILKRLDIELSKINSELRRVERLEADLFRLRSQGYGDIWRLTDAFNLFGRENEINVAELSDGLRDWYFEHGQILGQNAKNRYFLVQEVLGFARIRSLEFQRPSDEALYAGTEHTVEVIDEMRERLKEKLRERLKEETRKRLKTDEEQSATPENSEQYVDAWKSTTARTTETENWLLLQFLLSRLRTSLIAELRQGG